MRVEKNPKRWQICALFFITTARWGAALGQLHLCTSGFLMYAYMAAWSSVSICGFTLGWLLEVLLSAGVPLALAGSTALYRAGAVTATARKRQGRANCGRRATAAAMSCLPAHHCLLPLLLLARAAACCSAHPAGRSASNCQTLTMWWSTGRGGWRSV